MTLDEMIEAEEDPAHPRHEEVMEANRQMAEKFKGLLLTESSMGSIAKMAEAITKGPRFAKMTKGIFPVPLSSRVLPQERLTTPLGPTILQRQLAATDQVIQQLTELVRVTKADADAARIDAADARVEALKAARWTRHGLLIGWLGVILAAIAVVVAAIVGS
ncbi:MAG: hypothetical protein HHJ13_14740 [Phycicoccus sp.]|nr:hypothetical protein [Phycicoccus sp.]